MTQISHSSKVMLKVLQARLQQCMNHELSDVQTGFRKGRRTRDPNAKNLESLRKQEGSRKKKQNKTKQKTPISALLTMSIPLNLWIAINCGRL